MPHTTKVTMHDVLASTNCTVVFVHFPEIEKMNKMKIKIYLVEEINKNIKINLFL